MALICLFLAALLLHEFGLLTFGTATPSYLTQSGELRIKLEERKSGKHVIAVVPATTA